mgnify:CR=1 FL=1
MIPQRRRAAGVVGCMAIHADLIARAFVSCVGSGRREIVLRSDDRPDTRNRTLSDKEEPAADNRDEHNEMWEYAVKRIGATDAETVFLDGLAAAKVKMIRTDDQAAIVKAHIDQITEGTSR